MKRREFLQTLAVGGAAWGLLPQTAPVFGGTATAAKDEWAQAAEILRRIKPPKFPARDFVLPKYGAKPDGTTLCTEAFRQAIEACHKAGGGRVVVPAGVWLTGAIHLQSNVNLHVSPGATVRFTTDTSQYPMVFTRWEGVELMNYSPFIYAFEQENIAVTGAGTLDGGSDNAHWWDWNGKKDYGWAEGKPNQRPARAKLIQFAESATPVEQRIFGAGSYLRPNFIQPYRCKNVLLAGVTIINSPMWEVHPVLCTNVTIRGLNIKSHGPNNDGCDPESCRDVLIEDCIFDTGDDCIAIKSGRNGDGRRVGVPTENVIIRRCQMKDGHGGITIGSEISGGVRNVFAENCVLDSPNLDHALRVKNNAVRGGLLENFYFRNIRVGQVAHAVITIDFNYEEGAKGTFTPIMRNYVVSGLQSGKSRYALDVQGLANAPVEHLRLEKCDFANVARGNVIAHLNDAQLVNVKINGQKVMKL